MKIRCEGCGRVAYDSMEAAEKRAALISEKTPMVAFQGECGNFHVTGKTEGNLRAGWHPNSRHKAPLEQE